MDKEIEIEKWRANLVPRLGIRCKHCTEKQEELTHPDAYTTQIPRAVIVRHSKESIIFRGLSFQYVELMIETKCEVCGGINIYPLYYWDESKTGETNEREAK